MPTETPYVHPYTYGAPFSKENRGMTLRDYFAARVSMQEVTEFLPDTVGEMTELMLTLEIIKPGTDVSHPYGHRDCMRVYQWAKYQIADAMLEAREK